MSEKLNILVSVCTHRRPEMLRKCLQSIVAQPAPANWNLSILIVENDQHSSLITLCEQLSGESSYPILYRLEREQGIPFARNAAIEQALALSSEWLIFIDDDEVADVKWLYELDRTMRHHCAEVIHGEVAYIYPPEDRWAHLNHRKPGSKGAELGRPAHSAATDNVMISRKVFADWALRFDTKMRFSGGSDTEFFNRARLHGAKIIASSSPLVYTLVQPERCRLSWLFEREARIGAASVYIDRKHFGESRALLKHARRCCRNLFLALINASLIPWAAIRGIDAFRLQVLKSVLKFGRSWGGFLGIFGKLLAPYQYPDGH